MTDASQRFQSIDVGTRVVHAGRLYDITHLMGANRVLAMDIETKGTATLRIDELTVATAKDVKTNPAEPAQRDVLSYDPKEWAVGQERLEAIRPLLQKPVRTAEEVQALATKHGVHMATVYRWLKSYNQEGTAAALVPSKRGRKAGQTLLPDNQEKVITSAIEDLFLSKQRHKKADVIEEVMRRCRLAKIDAPHGNTVLRRIASIDPAHALRRRGQRDKARNHYAPIQDEFPDGTHPLAAVQVDHTQADIIVVDEVSRQPIGRPWLTLAIDTYSRMIAGFYLTFEKPSAASVGMCLAQAICPKREYLAHLGVSGEWPVWGLMSVVHTDNAKEFRGNVLRRACENYAINIYWRAVPQTHWGGTIERMMGTMANELRKLPGATFANTAQRKGYDSEATAAMTIGELERHLVDFIVNVYHQRVHSKLGMPPKRKWEIGVFGDGTTKGTGLIHVPEDPLRVRLDFMPYFERSIQQYGIQIDTVSYYDPILDPYINAMDPKDPKRKRKFLIRRDPRDISKVYFYDPKDNRYTPVAYRNIGLPAISVRELYEAQARLREEGRGAVDETVIFEAIERMRSRVDDAKGKTKAARRQVAKRPSPDTTAHAPKRPALSVNEPSPSSDDPFSQPITPFDEVSLNR